MMEVIEYEIASTESENSLYSHDSSSGTDVNLNSFLNVLFIILRLRCSHLGSFFLSVIISDYKT